MENGAMADTSLERWGTFKGRSVLVTGHTGFKGSWLALWLNQLGARVAGYALDPGEQAISPVPGPFHPEEVVLVDPSSGSLLATEELQPMPGSLHCIAQTVPKFQCVGPAYVGRSYQGQVDKYVAVVSDGWTNAEPPLPPQSSRSGPTGFPGLPPLS